MSTHISGIYLLLEGDTSEVSSVQLDREISWNTDEKALRYLKDDYHVNHSGEYYIYEKPSIFTHISGVNTTGITTDQILQYNGTEFVPVDMVAGSTDHNTLTNRDMANQHPIAAISGLQSALDGKLSTVTTDATLTGNGTSTNPLSVVGGGGVPGSGHWDVAVIASGEVLYNDKDYAAIVAGSIAVQPRGKLNGLIDDGITNVTTLGTCPVTGPNLTIEIPCHLLVAGSSDGSGIDGVGNADGKYTYVSYDPNGSHGDGDHYYLKDGSDDVEHQGVWIMRVASVWCVTNDMSPGNWTDSCYTTTALSPVNANWSAMGTCTGTIQVEESDDGGNYIPNVGSIGLYTNMDLLVHGSASIDRNAHIHETLLVGRNAHINETLLVASGAYYDFNNTMNSSSNGKMLVPKEYLDTVISGIIIPPGSNQNLSGVLSEGNDGGAQQITNILDPAALQDAATKNYVDTEIGNIVFPSGTTLSGVLTAGNDGGAKQIKNILDPTVATDAATMSYVDTQISSIPSGVTPDLQAVTEKGALTSHSMTVSDNPASEYSNLTKDGLNIYSNQHVSVYNHDLAVIGDQAGGSPFIKIIPSGIIGRDYNKPLTDVDYVQKKYVDTAISGIVIPSGSYTLQDITDNGPYTNDTFGFVDNTTKVIFGRSGADVPTIELVDATNTGSLALVSGVIKLSGNDVEVATQSNPLKGNAYHTPTDDKDYTQKKYVDSLGIPTFDLTTGSTTIPINQLYKDALDTYGEGTLVKWITPFGEGIGSITLKGVEIVLSGLNPFTSELDTTFINLAYDSTDLPAEMINTFTFQSKSLQSDGTVLVDSTFTPTASGHIVNKAYVDNEISNINIPSGTLQDLASVLTAGNDGGAKQIKNISYPTDATDAATMSYVDAQVSGIIIPSGITSSGNFLGLTDTPGSYAGNEGKRVTVNNDGNGLIFTEESGLGIASAKYKFSNSISGDPTAGHASMNNATFASVTKVFISKTDINGASAVGGLAILKKNDYVSYRDRNSTDHMNFKITDAGTDEGAYYSFDVAPGSHIGAHNNNENIYVEMLLVGAKNFTGLLDTPDTYSGSAGMIPVVNAAETALELVNMPSGVMWEQGNTVGFIKPSNSKLIEVNTANDFGGVINAAPLAPDVSGGINVSNVENPKTAANGHYTFESNDVYKHDSDDFYVLRLVDNNMWVLSEDNNTSSPVHDMTKVISYKFTSPEHGLGHYYGFNGNSHATVGDTNDKMFFNAISTTGTIYSDTDIKANQRFIVGHGAIFEHNDDGGVNIIGVPNISGVPFSVYSADTEILKITATGTVLAPGSTVSGLTQKKELVTKEYVDTMVLTKAMTIAEPQPGDHFTMWITTDPIIIEKVVAISSNGETTFNIIGSATGDIFATNQTCNTVPVLHIPDQNQTIGELATVNVAVNSTTVTNGHFNVTVHYRYVG